MVSKGVRVRTHKVSGDETMHPGAEKNGSQQQESRDRSISITPSHAGARVRCELVVVQMGFGSDAVRTRSKVGLIPWNIKLLCRRVHDLPDFQHAAAASSNNRQPASGVRTCNSNQHRTCSALSVTHSGYAQQPGWDSGFGFLVYGMTL